jgi:hypothetical protein
MSRKGMAEEAGFEPVPASEPGTLYPKKPNEANRYLSLNLDGYTSLVKFPRKISLRTVR